VDTSKRMRRRRLELALADVESFLSMDEGWLLYEAARCSRSGRVAEIGSHKGRSTIALALGVVARGEGSVLAIDPFDAEIDGERGDERLKQFEQNLSRAQIADRVVLRRQLSHDVAPSVASGSLDVLFIDGSHEYEDVIQDIDDWMPKMVDGGLMLFNDPVIAEVGWALRDRVATRESKLRRAALVRNTLLTYYLPSAPWTFRDETRRVRLRVLLPFLWRFVQAIERLGTGGRFKRIAAFGAFCVGRTLIFVMLPGARLGQELSGR